MTPSRHNHRLHRHRRGRLVDAVRMAWADDDHLDAAKRGVHDALVADLGDLRRSAVEWRIYDARDGLDFLTAWDETSCDKANPEVRRLLVEKGGWLIVATCKAWQT